MQELNEIIKELRSISKRLEKLNSESAISQLPDTYDFDDIQVYTVKAENLLLALTHETASQLAFSIIDFELLVKFIEFRSFFYEFNQEELQLIIDSDHLNTAQKRNLTQNKKEKDIAKIRTTWFKMFKNKSFKQLSEA